MQITLPPEIQAIIENEIDSGRYATAEEVVIGAIRHLQEDDLPIIPDEWLVEARAEADRGEGVEVDDDFRARLREEVRIAFVEGAGVSDDVTY